MSNKQGNRTSIWYLVDAIIDEQIGAGIGPLFLWSLPAEGGIQQVQEVRKRTFPVHQQPCQSLKRIRGHRDI